MVCRYGAGTDEGRNMEQNFPHWLTAGSGYDTVDGNFRRTQTDVPIRLALNEYAKPGHVIAYTPAGERIHTRKDLIRARG
jgi:hypothetical protein